MKQVFKYSTLLVGICFFQTISIAQTEVSSGEKRFNFETYFFEALKQNAIENYVKAIENLENCLEIDRENTAVFFEFSKNYFQLKKYFEAELFIDKALVLNPLNRFMLIHKVEILKRKQDYKSAIEIQQKLVKNYPEYSDGLLELFFLNKNNKEAEQIILKMEMSGLSTLKSNELKDLMELENGKEIVLKPILKVQNLSLVEIKNRYLQHKEYTVLKQILEMELQQGLFDLLFEDSKNALELFPSQTYVYKMNAIALHKLGKYNESNDVLTNGIDFVIDKEEEALFYDIFVLNHQKMNNTSEVLKFKQKSAQLRKKH